ncbi:hypothetical protein [Bacillus thuringiensis]|uniref:hypothetical protein n=1 Tax=Bacillus thuringiensis TaxID=1428 RepID=UPI000BF425F2|nr:hypothetical protein [Bacillus thuringiensis]PEV64218.1 hypothetical protein CN434_25755 [Bacillus thuringiensis]
MVIEFKEAVEMLEDGMEVVLECDGHDYEISDSENWLGGDAHEGYISLVLGNMVYESAETALRESIDFLEKSGKSVTIKDS